MNILAALDLSDAEVDDPPRVLRAAPSKEILVPETDSKADLRNTLKGKISPTGHRKIT